MITLTPIRKDTKTTLCYIARDDIGTRIGVLWDGVSKVEFLTEQGFETFTSMNEFTAKYGDVSYVEEEEVSFESSACVQDLDGYPVLETDVDLLDVELDEKMGVKSFRRSARSKKRYYAGWFALVERGKWVTKLTLPVDKYESCIDEGTVKGAFKTQLEAQAACNL